MNRRLLPIGMAVSALAIASIACTSLFQASEPEISFIPQQDNANVVQVVDSEVVTETQEQSAEPATSTAQTVAPDAEEVLLNDIYETSAPSVVLINVTTETNLEDAEGLDLENLPEGFEVPDSFFGRGSGSGFIIDKDGHIVTNNHVVQNASTVQVTFFDGLIARAEVLGTDPDSDLAVIKVDIDPSLLEPIALADSDEVFVGQRAIALGNPFGETWTLTAGIVSAVGRTQPSGLSQFSIPEMVQTDAAINPGNSGGPLIDADGDVIGVNTLILSESGSSSGVGFAIPANIVAQVVPDLIAFGEYKYPFLGITGSPLSLDQIEAMGLDITQRGAMVVDVFDGTPAATAGLQGATDGIEVEGARWPIGGDIIIQAGDDEITNMDDLIAFLVKKVRPGDTVDFTLIRDGEIITVPVTLAERPERINR